MQEFAERMKALADQVHACACERETAVARVKGNAEHLLSKARSFVTRTAEEHLALACHIHKTLADHRRERTERFDTMHRENQRCHRDMADKLREMFTMSRQAREETVNSLLESFRATRHAVANDLREASRFWRELQGGRRHLAAEHARRGPNAVLSAPSKLGG